MKIKNFILLVLGSFLASITTLAQMDTIFLSISDCYNLAESDNYQIQISDEQVLLSQNMQKSTRSKYFGRFNFVGQYQFNNKQLQLFEDNLFIPVVPIWAIDQETMDLDPAIIDDPLFHGIVTDPTTGEIMTDPEGNPLFFFYSYLPSDHLKFGNTHNFVLGPSFIQPLYLGGKIRILNSMADSRVKMTKSQKIIDNNEVYFEIQDYYWLIVDLQEKQNLLKQFQEFIDRLIYDLENLHEEGIITYNDVLTAKVKKNELDLESIKLESGLDLATMYLCHLIGLPFDSNIFLTEDLDKIPILPNPDNIYSTAITNREEIKLLESLEELAFDSYRLAKSQYLPNVTFSANYLFMNPNPYAGFTKEFGSNYTFGLNINIPIYSFGERMHNLHSAENLMQITELKKEETKSLISLEIQQAWYSYKEALKTHDLHKKALNLADENLKITQDKYDVGMLTSRDLIEARANYHKSYSDLIEAKTNLKVMEIEYNKKLGTLNK
jgi:outer membrane protein